MAMYERPGLDLNRKYFIYDRRHMTKISLI